jgi:hypothetical protein
MSVEAIVIILVASVTVGIFTVKFLAAGLEDSGSPVPSRVVGLRHDAISEAPSSDTSQDVATAAAAQGKSSQRSANGGLSVGDRALTEPSNDMIVRNGVTILSPPLLVPVINDDAIQMASGSEVLPSPHKAASARKRSHYANRAHARGRQRVARSAPFWRVVAR